MSIIHVLVAGVWAACGCGLHVQEQKGGARDSWLKTQGHHYKGGKQQRKDRSAHEDNFDAQNKIIAP